MSTQLVYSLPCAAYYHWQHFLHFQSQRLIEGIEAIEGDLYQRTIMLDGHSGCFSLRPAGRGFTLTVTPELTHALPTLIAKVNQMFDLPADTAAIERHLRRCYPALPITEGLHIPGVPCPFEAGIRAICGQRISVKAATRLINQLVQACTRPDQQGRWHFPAPADFTQARLDAISMMGSKRATLLAFSQWWQTHEPQALDQILHIKGIGRWTLDYLKLRGCNHPDIWMDGDLAIRQAQQQLTGLDPNLAAPFRSYLMLQLWYALARQRQPLTGD